jgi:hypothetical protein
VSIIKIAAGTYICTAFTVGRILLIKTEDIISKVKIRFKTGLRSSPQTYGLRIATKSNCAIIGIVATISP